MRRLLQRPSRGSTHVSILVALSTGAAGPPFLFFLQSCDSSHKARSSKIRKGATADTKKYVFQLLNARSSFIGETSSLSVSCLKKIPHFSGDE